MLELRTSCQNRQDEAMAELKLVPKTLAQEVEAKIDRQARWFAAEGYDFDDWQGLTAAEEEVFGIKPDRLARLVIVWDAYMAFLDLQVPLGYDEGLVVKERDRLPEIFKQGYVIEGFMAFAKNYSVSNREAHAVWAKVEWHQARSGILAYADEPKEEREAPSGPWLPPDLRNEANELPEKEADLNDDDVPF